MLYILTEGSFTNLERIEELTWELIKANPNPELKNYVTKDIEDEELQKHGLDTIIWERVWDPYYKFYRKVIVPFTPYDINAMEKAAEIKKEEIKNLFKKFKIRYDHDQEIKTQRIQKEKNSPERIAQKAEIGKIRNELDKQIPMEMEELEALKKWQELGFCQPTAHRIEEIKNSYHMSWSLFMERVNYLLGINQE